jgi:hypothetical protein
MVLILIAAFLVACSGNPNEQQNESSQVSVSVSPTAVSMNQGAQQQFTATVTGTSNTAVNWSLISGSGTVNSSGLFTAPNKQETDTIQAQSQADTTKTATATATVSAVGISISPLSATVAPGGTQQFNATISGTTNHSVQWTEVGNGTVSQTGLYTAPSSTETDTVTVMSLADRNQTSSASVSVQPGSQSQSQCGISLNWTSSVCQQVNGTLSPIWSVISRHGEYAQDEDECNIPSAITAGSGQLIITAADQPTQCNSFDPVSGDPTGSTGPWDYTTGDIEWNTYNFLNGTIVWTMQMPSESTALWPAIWMMGTNCQAPNKYTGDPGTGGCPLLGSSGYEEMDIVECDVNNWCDFGTYNPGKTNGYDFSLDTSQHTFMLVWTASTITLYKDGSQVGSVQEHYTNPMFLIIQIQAGGIGSPDNSLLPASMTVGYVKVCSTTDGSCASVPATDPTVTCYDNFEGTVTGCGTSSKQ